MKTETLRRQGVKAFARAHNLAGRLTRAALESSAMALFVAGVTINVLVYTGALSNLRSDAGVHAQIAADSAAPAVLFVDSKTATETLEFLRASPEVTGAVIYDTHGQVFARYAAAQGTAASKGLQYPRSLFQVTAPLVLDGKSLGRIALSVSELPLWLKCLQLALITAGSALFGLGIANLRVRSVRRAVMQTEEDLDRLAFFDPVTGLHNRHAAKAFLDEAVADPLTPPFPVALLDLDDFKLVNDTMGHKAGDDLLSALGARLQAACGEGGTVFRLGGDEFIVAWTDCRDVQDVKALGQRLVKGLADPLTVMEQPMFVRASVGLATYPAHGTTAQELMRAADTAMYQAKAAGKNTSAVYDDSMAKDSSARLQLSTELSLALERHELVLHYQPIIDIATNELIGVEALVRWNHPERGFLAAAQFVNVAEESGLVVELGGWVLKAAAHQQVAWAAQGLGHLFIAVNASAQQFKRDVLSMQMRAALEESGANPEMLQIELTEYTLVEDVASNVRSLTELRDMGIKVAIDDFGTGLSSLAYLKRLPIDKLKIDRSFVDDLATGGHEDTAIVTAIVSLAHALDLEVVAEGIETVAQLERLRELGAEHGQGYLFSRPVSAARINELAGSCPWANLQGNSVEDLAKQAA